MEHKPYLSSNDEELPESLESDLSSEELEQQIFFISLGAEEQSFDWLIKRRC